MRDELAEICGEISRAAEFRGAARFRGNTVLAYYDFEFSTDFSLMWNGAGPNTLKWLQPLPKPHPPNTPYPWLRIPT